MAEARYWDKYDADAIVLWLGDLSASGYQQAALVDWVSTADSLSTSLADSATAWRQLDSGELESSFSFVPQQETSIHLTDTLHNHTLAPAVPSSLEGCVYADVEVKMSSIWASRELLATFLESYKLNMPCFPRFHLAVPDNEVALFETFLAEKEIPNAVVHPEKLPAEKPVWFVFNQMWSEFWADQYIVRRSRALWSALRMIQTAPWIMFFDGARVDR